MWITITRKDGEYIQDNVQASHQLQHAAVEYTKIREITIDNYLFYPADPSSSLHALMEENNRLKRTLDCLLDKAENKR